MRFAIFTALFLVLNSPILAQDVSLEDIGDIGDIAKFLKEIEQSTLQIEESDAQRLPEFITEWNLVLDKRAERVLSIDNISQEQLMNSLKELGKNKEAIEFLLEPETESLFDSSYQKMQKSPSLIGALPRDQVLRYWIMGGAVSAGTEKPGVYFPARCWWPIIGCAGTPPTEQLPR